MASVPTPGRLNPITGGTSPTGVQIVPYGTSPTTVKKTPITPTTSSTDPYGGLTGDNRNAAAALENLFNSYGLGSLAGTIINYIKQGYSSDTISILLQQTPQYKARFPANDARLKAGLPVLSPAEYISTEESYRNIMQAAGLPTGFYDSTTDFSNMIASDVSPTELQSRVNTAAEAINNAPADTLNYFKQFYNTGDLVAYALDPTVAQPLIDQRIKASEAAALAAQNGAVLTQANAETIGSTGASLADIQSGVGFVAAEGKTDAKLNQMFGGDETQADLVAEAFTNNTAASQKRAKLAGQDKAQFTGVSGQGKASLATDSGF